MSSKAGFSEMYTVMNGVIGTGAALLRAGIKIQDHPLVGVAAEAASVLYNAQYKAATRPVSTFKTQDHIARPVARFLEAALPVLEAHSDTPDTVMVRDHVLDILVRETMDAARPVERFKEGGLPRVPFGAEYTQAARKFIRLEGGAAPEMQKDGPSKRPASEAFNFRRRAPENIPA